MHAEQLLGNSVLLTHEGYGHLSFQNPSTCVDEATVAYLTELITPPPGTDPTPVQEPRHAKGPGIRSVGGVHAIRGEDLATS